MIDELEILRAWAPPGEAPPDDAAAAARARARLHDHLAAATPGRARRRRRRLLVTVPAVALTAALVVALVVVLGTSRVAPQRHPYATAPTTAAAALEQAARAAETASPAFPRPDQFFYTKSIATYLACSMGAASSYCALPTTRTERWTSLDRGGELHSTGLKVAWPSAAERAKWVAAGRPRLNAAPRSGVMRVAPNHAYYLGNQRLSAAQVRAFDRSGAQLYRDLRAGLTQGQGPSPDGEVFVQINDALRDQPTTPKLRAALLQALALVPGIGFDGHAEDRLGRPAVAISHVDRGVRHELLLDPRTSALLGERDVVVTRARNLGFDAVPGTRTGDAAYEALGVVDAIGDRP